MNYHERIVRDAAKGTRVTLRTILASLAEGDSTEDILRDFPSLKPDDIKAVIAFAANQRTKP